MKDDRSYQTSLSDITFGTWQMGGARWSHVSNPDAEQLVADAMAVGVTAFDTANVYGNGRAQVLLGNALRSYDRASYFLIAKSGYVTGVDGAQDLFQEIPRDFSPEALRVSIRESLQRLRVEDVDAFLLHDPPTSALVDTEVWKAVRSFKEEGLASQIGVSTVPKKIGKALEMGAEFVQIPVFSGQKMDGLELGLEKCVAAGVPVVARSVLQGGALLEGVPTERRNEEVRRLLSQALGTSSAIRSAIVGFERKSEIDSVVGISRHGVGM